MQIQRIKIDKSKNEQYYKILDDVDFYIDKWNKLNSEIRKVFVPKLFLKNVKRNLLKIGDDAENLNSKFQHWLEDISDFLVNPYINVEGSENPDLTFLHFKELLIRRVKETEDMFKLTNNNFQIKYNAFKNQVNFDIAIFGIIISLMAFCFSIFNEFGYNSTNFNKALTDSINVKLDSHSERVTEYFDSNMSKVVTKLDSVLKSRNYLEKKNNKNSNKPM